MKEHLGQFAEAKKLTLCSPKIKVSFRDFLRWSKPQTRLLVSLRYFRHLHHYPLTNSDIIWQKRDDNQISVPFHSLPVLLAAFMRPRLNISLSRGFMEKFLAPPVTEMRRFGFSRPQCSIMSDSIVSMDVSWSTLTYCREKCYTYHEKEGRNLDFASLSTT